MIQAVRGDLVAANERSVIRWAFSFLIQLAVQYVAEK